jgi:hypothetical protein
MAAGAQGIEKKGEQDGRMMKEKGNWRGDAE